jgi:GAF domain-containing protein
MRRATSDQAPSQPNNSAAEDRTGVTLRAEEPRVVAEEQAALRRLATLVARGPAPQEVFAAVTEEVGRLLSADYAHVGRYEHDGAVTFLAASGQTDRALPAGTRLKLGGKNVSTLVFETCHPARVDSYADASGPSAAAALERGARSSVGAPIIVEGTLWGVMVVGSSRELPLPADTEGRLASFTELVGTAVANAQSRGELARLAEEQAALRRVATLVARGTPQTELFAAVTEEVGRVLRVDAAAMARYESDETMTAVAIWSRTGRTLPATGSQHQLGGQNVSTLVFETGRAARIDSYAGDASGSIAGEIHTLGVRSAIGAPISVEGRVWGVIHAASTGEQPLPADAEGRLVSFTELVATAVANAQSRGELARLAEEQAALRRVATLAASGITQNELFPAVSEEVGQLLGAHLAGMARYNSDETVTVVATWAAEGSEHPLVPGPWPLGGGDLASEIWRAGQPVRIADYRTVRGRIATFVREGLGIGSSVGSPILVEGQLWGALFVHAKQTDPPPPPDTESRLTSFAELVATAVASAESRAGLARITDEQAALRRVATLVARGVPPEELFAAVAGEVVRLLPVDFAHMGHYEADGTVTVVAASGSTAEDFHVGSRWNLGGQNLTTIVVETGRSARLDRYSDAFGALGVTGRELGIRSSVGTPIMVEDQVWGIVTAGSTFDDSLPTDLESRLENFTELVATAIANAESRAEVAASRTRIVAAADESRRRIERDLHDGAQQRLVHAVIALKLALRAMSDEKPNADELVAEALRHAEQANAELRELAHGILPAALTRGGLQAGVDALVSRVSLPVSVDVSVGRLPAAVEATAYFIISEALTNVVKHARAAGARVTAAVERGQLRVEVRDDGVGGARAGENTGLGGLADRVSALDGRLELESLPGAGTRVCALLPLSGLG